MADYLSLIASRLGISVAILIVIIFWSLVWKLIALWTAARNNSKIWFIVLALVNSIGILEILYIFGFSRCCKAKPNPSSPIPARRRTRIARKRR